MLVFLVSPHSSRWSNTSRNNVNRSNNSSTSNALAEDFMQQAYDDALQWQQLQKEMGSLLSTHQLTRTTTTTNRKRNNKQQRQHKSNSFGREFEALKLRFGINRAAATDTDTTTVFNLTAVNTCDDDDADHTGSDNHDIYNSGPEIAFESPTSQSNSSCASPSAVGAAITAKICSTGRNKHWKPNCRAHLQWTNAAGSDSISGIAHYIIADTAVPRSKSYTSLRLQPSSTGSTQQLHEHSLSSSSKGPRLSVTSTPSVDNSVDAAAAAASAAARRNSFTIIHKPKQAAAAVNDDSSAKRRLSRSNLQQFDNDRTDISCASRSVLQQPESAVHHVELPLITGSIADDNSSSIIMMAY
eukprot:15925-Heterococcus_DN1.PRE.3